MKHKTALITGASRGIGKGIATAFAKDGYDVIITCKNSKDELFKLMNELSEAYHVSVKCFVGDLSKPEIAVNLFDDIDQLDVLVNNAGISYIGLLSDMTFEEWDNIISTNLSSAFYLSKMAIPLMLSQKSGKIVNISSIWGDRGASMEVAYSATKGGINAFTKALAKELAPSNIQVNAVACGLIDTDMNSHFSDEEINSIIEEIPADRIGHPDEVADLVLQICTGNRYLTGQIIGLDGGW